MSATTTPLLPLLLLLLLSVKLTKVFGESLEAQESARYYEKDFERGGYGGGGYGGGGGGGYCCQQGGYPSLLELLVPLLLLGILFYLIMNNNNNSSSSGTGRKKRELPKEDRDDLVNWDEIIEASGSYVRSGALSPCYEFYVCAINRQSRKLAAGPALLFRESSVALSGLIMKNNMENITSAAIRGFNGVDCSSMYPECTALNSVL